MVIDSCLFTAVPDKIIFLYFLKENFCLANSYKMLFDYLCNYQYFLYNFRSVQLYIQTEFQINLILQFILYSLRRQDCDCNFEEIRKSKSYEMKRTLSYGSLE